MVGKKIAIVGLGYVGLSNAILLSQRNNVIAVDTDKYRVDLINQKRSPIQDVEINSYLKDHNLNLTATADWKTAYQQSDIIVIATPTDYDEEKNYFNTSSVESVIQNILTVNRKALIVIKSTIPVGFVDKAREKFDTDNLIFSPEFLREGKALYDNLYPSRIIVGEKSERAREFASLLVEGALKKDVEVLLTNSNEAEAIKLFANTYLALRVSFFNELDTYAELKNLDARQIIDGISLDPRIGNYYNNPSFGYGGYCLPKDTKQLLANYKDVPNDIITAVVNSNNTRKKFIVDRILSVKPKTVGIYRLIMKHGSDNFRYSAIHSIISSLQKNGVKVVIYEPTLSLDIFNECPVEHNLIAFKKSSDLVLCNRMDDDLLDIVDKVYTRDLFNIN